MKKYVIDSYAFIAYLEGEEEGKGLIPFLESAVEGKCEMYMSVINWGEIYYIAYREGGKERAELYRTTIEKYPVTITDVDKNFTLSAAKFKAKHKMSYADAFAASLCEHLKGTLITVDKEFKPLQKEINIYFL